MRAFNDDLLLGSAQFGILFIRDVAFNNQFAIVGHIFIIGSQTADDKETMTIVQHCRSIFRCQSDRFGNQSGINADFLDFLRQGFDVFFGQNRTFFKQALAAVHIIGQNTADQT